MAQFRASVISSLRSFFDRRGYLEVDTPLLAPALIPEAHLEVYATEFLSPTLSPEDPRRMRYLIPSPEVWMKQLLAAGYGDIYQLSHCFRNHESVGPQHSPEFTMLEWYTTDASYLDAADTADELLKAVGRAARTCGDPTSDGGCAHSAGAERNLEACLPPAERLTLSDAFERFCGIGPPDFDDHRAMAQAGRELGLDVRDGEAPDDVFQRIFIAHVEPALPRDHPVILLDYPAFVPTLAEPAPDGPFARRWELYVAGIEVANCYQEERDLARLERFLEHASAAKASALVPHPPERSLLQFAAAPPCAGVALGVDRLIMALTGTKDIREVIF